MPTVVNHIHPCAVTDAYKFVAQTHNSCSKCGKFMLCMRTEEGVLHLSNPKKYTYNKNNKHM